MSTLGPTFHGQRQQDLEALQQRVEGVNREQRRIAQRLEQEQAARGQKVDAALDDLREDLASQERALEEVRGAVARLDQQAGWLEHHLAQLLDLPVAELDAADDEVRELAGEVLAGREARARFLDEDHRAAAQQRVDDHEKLREEKIQEDLRLVAESRRIVDEPAATRGAHSGRFFVAMRRVDELAQQLAESEAGYRHDREELDRDERARDRARPTVDAEQRAESRLHDLLAERIERAISERARLPTWFTGPLGHGPTGDRDEWMAVATEVVTHRIVYGVADPRQALGERDLVATEDHQGRYDALATRLARAGRAL